MSNLKEALKEGNVEMVVKCMQDPTFEVDNHHSDYYKSTPFMTAVCYTKRSDTTLYPQRISIIKMLLDAGAKQEASVTWQGKPGLFEIVENDLVEVVKMICNDYHWDITQSAVHSDQTIFHVCQSAEMATLLLDFGIDPNVRDDKPDSLSNGLFNTTADVARVLIERGCDVNWTDARNYSALLRNLQYISGEWNPGARERNLEVQIELCNLLLDKGANVLIGTEYYNENAVKIATKNASASDKKKKELYARICKISTTQTPLVSNFLTKDFVLKVKSGDIYAVQNYLKEPNSSPYATSKDGMCLLLHAIPEQAYALRDEHVKTITFIFNAMFGKAVVDDDLKKKFKTWFNQALLKVSIFNDLPAKTQASVFDVIQSPQPLLDLFLNPQYSEWLDINFRLTKTKDLYEHEKGNSPIFFVNSDTAFSMLLAAGANLNHQNALGQTCLFSRGPVSIFEFYIQNGADIEHVDYLGQTPLTHFCQKMYSSETYANDKISILLKKGANIYTKNKSGKNALDFSDDIARQYYLYIPLAFEIKLSQKGLSESDKENLRSEEKALFARAELEHKKRVIEMPKEMPRPNVRCGADVEEVLSSGIPCCHEEVQNIMNSLNLSMDSSYKNIIIESIALRCMCVAMTDDQIKEAILNYAL